MAAAEENSPRSLRRRAEDALSALAEGRTRLASGLQAVKLLQQELAIADARLGLDLREVQQSTVEHAAMYARNPEVLGGMLHLTFSLDSVRQWLERRDSEVEELAGRLSTVEEQLAEQSTLGEHLSRELVACSNFASALEEQAKVAAAAAASRQASVADVRRPSTVARESKELIELRQELKMLREENAELQDQLSAARATPTPMQGSSIQHLGQALPSLQAPMSSQAPIQTLLTSLEQLEPLLAAMPAGDVPGMWQLQEEACEAYGRMRMALLEASAMPQVPQMPWVPPMPRGDQNTEPLTAQFTWRSSSSDTMASSAGRLCSRQQTSMLQQPKLGREPALQPEFMQALPGTAQRHMFSAGGFYRG
eukprot:TRINITY_DN87493_c0_g1_i1.p1 TRINITY_DN87493_c0_g1~~TRINITY_DN87493_c0_g1_i1.p1  ORF type:complete len:366 (+),score=71.41 TRINITY_DN87493_c0_g1_i1:160-1257(+)